MPYAEPYVYLRCLGVFGATATTPLEEWGVGFKFRHPEAAPSPTQLTTFLESAATAVATYHGGSTRAGDHCWLTELTAAFIGTDGKYVGGGTQSTIRHTYGTPVIGIGATIGPYANALVISLRTAVKRGPGSNGRAYWPATALSVSGDTGGLTTTQLGPIVTEAAALLNGLNTAKLSAMPATGKLSVMSAVGSGIAATVTGFRIGRRLDTQERREKKIPEGWVSGTVSAAAAQVTRNSKLPIGEPQEL